MTTLPPEVPADLLRLLRQVVGPRVEVVRVEVRKHAQDYQVLLVQLRQPDLKVVVKLAGPDAAWACPFERMAWLHRLVAQHTSVPIPEVLGADTSYQAWPWRYIVKTYLPGQEWVHIRDGMPLAARAGAYRQIGEAVGQLHTLQFPEFGELIVDGSSPPTASFPRVESFPCAGSFPRALEVRARMMLPRASLRDLFLMALDQNRPLLEEVTQPNLCHEDLHGYNLLFLCAEGQWSLSGILDFEKAWAGQAEIDLARLELWTGMTSPEFWDAYTAHHTLAPGYAARRPLYQLLWCLEYAQPTARHLQETQRVCAQLGLPPFAGFG
jgi:Ser/Thr protein kinase RdoA (MazF antagonist)